MSNFFAHKSVFPIVVAAGGIYTAQSVVGGLTFMGLPAYLRAQNIPLDQIGAVSLIMLIWVVKFFWSSWIENLRIGPNGQRFSRLIIVIAEWATVICLLALGSFQNISVVLLVLGIIAAISATADIACDAFLIEQLSAKKYGIGNIAQVGGGYLGMIFGGGLFLWICDQWDWQKGCIILAVLIALLSLPMMLTKEPAVINSTPLQKPSLLKALTRPNMVLGLFIVIAFEMAGRITQSLIGPFLVDAHIPLSMVGLINGVGGVVAGISGALAGGAIAQRLGGCKAMRLVAALQILLLSLIACLVLSQVYTVPLIVGIFMLESALMAAGFVTSYSRLMQLVSKDQPGVDFTLFQSASALTAAIFGVISGLLAQYFGYGGSFLLAACLACLTPFILKKLENHIDKDMQS
ncbi:MFS transporter (plasmid) [Bartonella sp. HY329]|uniref:MFS transporter n=1 Tax=unclassified Bartonella TaxID=2645622 RepID=UPI0021C6D742|nr:MULTISPECIES: MFS transporter [unclassified Bartonella]UXM96593.1 MFS transporter [Bartonella sp. HY329]UXN10916.1 MFS transporter [Bartonella sp. HY328]